LEVTPEGYEDGQLTIDVRGDLAGILAISVKAKPSSTREGGAQGDQNLNLRPQSRRPAGPAAWRALASQFEMVAGTHNQFYLLYIAQGLRPKLASASGLMAR